MLLRVMLANMELVVEAPRGKALSDILIMEFLIFQAPDYTDPLLSNLYITNFRHNR